MAVIRTFNISSKSLSYRLLNVHFQASPKIPNWKSQLINPHIKYYLSFWCQMRYANEFMILSRWNWAALRWASPSTPPVTTFYGPYFYLFDFRRLPHFCHTNNNYEILWMRLNSVGVANELIFKCKYVFWALFEYACVHSKFRSKLCSRSFARFSIDYLMVAKMSCVSEWKLIFESHKSSANACRSIYLVSFL